jgi:hypothetical protein
VVLGVGAAVMAFRAGRTPGSVILSQQGGAQVPPEARGAEPPSQPEVRGARVIAVTLSPNTVRGAADEGMVTIAPDTDAVVVRLAGDPAAAAFATGRVVIRTVDGRDVWQGPAAAASSPAASALTAVEIPAAALGRDDYVVTLLEADGRGGERERYRYVLRVRRL